MDALIKFQEIEEQDQLLTHNVDSIIDQIKNFNENQRAYKISQMELSRKAVEYQRRRNKKMRDQMLNADKI